MKILTLSLVLASSAIAQVTPGQVAPPAPAGSDQPASCCAVATKEASCCAAAETTTAAGPVATSPLPSGSIYQLDGTFVTDEAKPFRLETLRGRPVLLVMFFSSCTYACPMIVSDLTRLRASLPEAQRHAVAIVLVSFDVARDTPAQLRRFRTERALDDGWSLLRGGEAEVAELAALLGVKYRQEMDGQFAHSNLITLLNREGEVVHQRAGLEGGLDDAALALRTLEAAR